jgi:hypothetical protein
MLIFNKEISAKWVIIGGVTIVILAILAIISIHKSPPVTPIATINDTQAILQKQYETQLKDKDTAINDYKSRLTISNEKYTSITNKYISLQKEKDNVKPPETNIEIRNRFVALGYPPISSK